MGAGGHVICGGHISCILELGYMWTVVWPSSLVAQWSNVECWHLTSGTAPCAESAKQELGFDIPFELNARKCEDTAQP